MIKFDEGEIYEITKPNGNKFVGYAYQINTIQKIINFIPIPLDSNIVIQLLPIKLNKKISLDLLEKFFNQGIAFNEKEIQQIKRMEVK